MFWGVGRGHIICLSLPQEYFVVDLERVYSKDWPDIEERDGKLIIRQGFLEPLNDPDAPYMFFYRYGPDKV